MLWLAPAFLLGLTLLGIPWWLHRLETNTTDREAFASLRFLQAAKKRIRVQTKLRYLVLMTLRMMMLALIALLFARPLFHTEATQDQLKEEITAIMVIDTSLSMDTNNRMEIAQVQAQDLINAYEDKNRLLLFSASNFLTQLADSETENIDILQTSLDTLSVTAGKLDYGQLIDQLQPTLDLISGSIELHIFSDFQENGQALRFADMIPEQLPSRQFELVLHPVTTQIAPNMYISTVAVVNDQQVVVGVTAEGFDEAQEIDVSLSVNDSMQTQRLMVSPGTGNLLSFNNLNLQPGDNKIDTYLGINDALMSDNIRYTVIDNSVALPVLLLTGNSEALSSTYLTNALASSPRPWLVETIEASSLDTRILSRYKWIIIDDLGLLDYQVETALDNYLNQGGAILAGLGTASNTLTKIPITGGTLISTYPGNEANFTHIESSHPVVGDAKLWSSVIVRPYSMNPTEMDNVLIDSASGPILLEHFKGNGKLLLFTAAFDNSTSDLPVRPVFITFMAQAAQYLSGEKSLNRDQLVGSFLQLGQNGIGAGQIISPSGKELLTLQDTVAAQVIRLEQTGYYRVLTTNSSQVVAVNADPGESTIALMSPSSLQNWMRAAYNEGSNTPSGTADEIKLMGEQKTIDPQYFLMILLIIFTLSEMLYGNRYLQPVEELVLTKNSIPETRMGVGE